MTKTPFIWLGSKRAEKRGVAPIGARLDYAAKMGLPVADGAILLHEFFELLLDSELIHWQNGRFHADDPQEIHDALYTAVRFPKITKPVIVYPAFPTNESSANAAVEFTNAVQLTNSLFTVWQAAGPPTSDLRRDVLVQEKINFDVQGSIVSKPNEPHDQVFLDVQTLNISRLNRWEPSDKTLPDFAQRLQKLMRGLRRTFGDESWEVAWGDNGRICYLTQLKKFQTD